jgi:hypothetical protein
MEILILLFVRIRIKINTDRINCQLKVTVNKSHDLLYRVSKNSRIPNSER